MVDDELHLADNEVCMIQLKNWRAEVKVDRYFPVKEHVNEDVYRNIFSGVNKPQLLEFN